jgi:hypothetical protein
MDPVRKRTSKGKKLNQERRFIKGLSNGMEPEAIIGLEVHPSTSSGQVSRKKQLWI